MRATRKLSVFPGLSAKRRDNIEKRGNNHDILKALTSTEFSQKFNIDYQKVEEVFLFHARMLLNLFKTLDCTSLLSRNLFVPTNAGASKNKASTFCSSNRRRHGPVFMKSWQDKSFTEKKEAVCYLKSLSLYDAHILVEKYLLVEANV